MKKCPACSRIYDDTQSFCLDDGTALLDEPTPAFTQETQVLPRKKKGKLPIVFVVLLIIIAALVAGWFLLGSKDGNKANYSQIAVNVQTPIPTPTPTETPTPLPSPSQPANVNVSTNSETVLPTTTETDKPLPVIMKTEDHSVLFSLHQCRKSGSSITCDLSLTNKGSDRGFQFVVYRSNLYDELGNSYNGKNGQVANQDGSNIRIGFIAGVTARAQITFEGVEPNAAKITLLRLQFDVGDDDGLEVKFRNVPLIVSK